MSFGAPLAGTERVLVRLPSWLGDFVASEPALRALELRLARGSLGLMGLGAHLELLAGRFPHAQRIALEARGADEPRMYTGWDVALLSTGSFRSAWCAWRAGVPRRVGFARDGRGWLLTDSMAPARERGATPLGLGRAGRGRRTLPRPLGRSLAELLGCVGVPLAHTRPRLDVSPAAVRAARARRVVLGLDPEAPFVLVNVGARAGSAKGVPARLWAGAIRAVRASDAQRAFVLACGPGEEPSLQGVLDELGEVRVAALLEPAASLGELLAHTADSALVWSGDTGPRHLARALGKPLVVVAGPTDPRHCGRTEDERLLRSEVPCGPCHLEHCPLAAPTTHQCMTRLDPAELLRLSTEFP